MADGKRNIVFQNCTVGMVRVLLLYSAFTPLVYNSIIVGTLYPVYATLKAMEAERRCDLIHRRVGTHYKGFMPQGGI